MGFNGFTFVLLSLWEVSTGSLQVRESRFGCVSPDLSLRLVLRLPDCVPGREAPVTMLSVTCPLGFGSGRRDLPSWEKPPPRS